MRWELRGFNTDWRYDDDIRYRAYTTNKQVAERFEKIPIHGIVFSAFECEPYSPKEPAIHILADYVRREMARIKAEEKAALTTE